MRSDGAPPLAGATILAVAQFGANPYYHADAPLPCIGTSPNEIQGPPLATRLIERNPV
jgi:hypothetical protein